jgi:CheY-like chemotaxis protein
VLIIDDNVSNIQLLVSVLERAGLHNVISATSGSTGLDLARNTELAAPRRLRPARGAGVDGQLEVPADPGTDR